MEKPTWKGARKAVNKSLTFPTSAYPLNPRAIQSDGSHISQQYRGCLERWMSAFLLPTLFLCVRSAHPVALCYHSEYASSYIPLHRRKDMYTILKWITYSYKASHPLETWRRKLSPIRDPWLVHYWCWPFFSWISQHSRKALRHCCLPFCRTGKVTWLL